MANSPKAPTVRGTARLLISDAAVEVIRTKGLSATTVDELCATAGVTKGAFFHHFSTKEALAIAAAQYWSETTGALFAASSYHDCAFAVDRIFGYLDLRAHLIAGAPAEYTCLVGTMAQEAFDTNPDVRAACAASIFGHAGTLEADFAEALAGNDVDAEITAASLARYTQAVLQGAFVLSKAANDPAIVIDSIDHLRRYLQFLFQPQGD